MHGWSIHADLRLRAGEVAAGEADTPAGDGVRGHLRVRAARVYDARRVQREDGRVRARRRAARAPHRPPRHRRRQAQPRRMGMLHMSITYSRTRSMDLFLPSSSF